MRRKDKEITDLSLIHEILDKAETLRLAMVDGDEPYIVSMNFSFLNNVIYLHSAKEGRKIDILRRNNRVAFTTDTDVYIVLGEQAFNCTTNYRSVFGTGRAFFVEDPEEKIMALNAIMEKHTGQGEYTFPENILTLTLIIRIDIDYLTGKKSGN